MEDIDKIVDFTKGDKMSLDINGNIGFETYQKVTRLIVTLQAKGIISKEESDLILKSDKDVRIVDFVRKLNKLHDFEKK